MTTKAEKEENIYTMRVYMYVHSTLTRWKFNILNKIKTLVHWDSYKMKYLETHGNDDN